MSNRALTLPGTVLQKIAILGTEGRRWLADLGELIASLEQDWQIRVGASLMGGTEAFVAEVLTATGTRAILKVAIPAHADNLGLGHEITALTIADGQGYARLLRSDLARRAFLLERLGLPLRELGYSTKDQIALICATLRQAWIALPPDAALPTGASTAQWFARFIADLWEQLAQPCSRRALDHALRCADARANAFDPARVVLVHGDAHNNNTLQDLAQPTGRFKFVDPDGLAAEPAYDLGILMREWIDELLVAPVRLGRERCAYLSHLTATDQQAIWEWGYLQSICTGLLLLQVGQQQEGEQMLMVAESWANA
ncbi:MAG: phosphotransferase [Ktedonobacterales bacterium]|nr:phosphotransferase [Ktedonobacterales bacterium]